MKKKISSLGLACAVVAVVAGCATPRHLAACEYKVVEGNDAPRLEAELSRLGSEGWMVISSSSATDPNSTSPRVVVILKRHK